MLTVGLYGIPDNGELWSSKGNTHDHGISIIKDGKVSSMTQLERFTRKKHDNRLCKYIPELLSLLVPANEEMQIISANSFLGSDLVSLDDRFTLSPKNPPRVADILTPSECTFDGQQIPAWTICHEFAHIASCLPFIGEFPENSLLVHIDGGASDSAASVWQWEVGHPRLLHASWDDLKDMTNNFNVNPLIHAILGLKIEDHLSMPGKLMGYASYGTASREIHKWLVDHEWFLSYTGDSDGLLSEINSEFGKSFSMFDPHEPFFMDIAATVQSAFENSVIQYLRFWKEETDAEHLFYAGGAALNILTNQRIETECGFKSIFIPPCTSDGGLALGAAAWKEYLDHGRLSLHSPYLDSYRAPTLKHSPESISRTASLLAEGKVVGTCMGSAEVGPRSLGHRSILARTDNFPLRMYVSETIKQREWYRPLAPVLLSDTASKILVEDVSHSTLPVYMLGSYTVKPEFRDAFSGVIHADGTIRAQIVEKDDPQTQYLALVLCELAEKYDILGLIQTSFNAKGMPLVQTYEDAIFIGNMIGLDEVITG